MPDYPAPEQALPIDVGGTGEGTYTFPSWNTPVPTPRPITPPAARRTMNPSELQRRASESATGILNPIYSSSVPSPAISPPGNAGAPDNRLYEAVHPNIFNKTLDTFKELFGMRGTSSPSDWWEKQKRNIAAPGDWFREQGRQLTRWPSDINLGPIQLRRRETPGYEFENKLFAPNIPREFGEISKGDFLRNQAGPSPIDLVKNHGGTYEVPGTGDWQDYGEGMRYRTGEGTPEGDRAARERIEGLTPPGSYYDPNVGTSGPSDFPIPQRGYYDVHPEERGMETYMNPYMKAIEDARTMAQGYGLGVNPKTARALRLQAIQNYTKLTGELPKTMADMARVGREYAEAGPGSPLSEERLASAYYHRRMPDVTAGWHEEATQARLQAARERSEDRLQAATDKRASEKERREQSIYENILKRYVTEDLMTKEKRVDLRKAVPEIRRMIKAGKLSEDWGLDLPEAEKSKYRVEGKGTIELDPEEEKEFLRLYPKAKKVS